MNTNSNNLQAMPTVTPEALGTVDERSKQNNVEDGLEQREKCFQDSADNPSTLADCSTLSKRASPPDSLRNQLISKASMRKTAGTCLIIALAAALFGFSGFAGAVVGYTKLVFLVFLLLAIAFFLVAKRDVIQ